MIAAALLRAIGSPADLARIVGGFVAGGCAALLLARLVLIPHAVEIAEADMRARFAAEAARHVEEAARDARKLEGEVRDASDDYLDCLLRGGSCLGVH